MLLPRMTCREHTDITQSCLLRKPASALHSKGGGGGASETGPQQPRTGKGGKAAHHHADVRLQLLVHRVVQHDVHELVKAAKHARDVPVCVERDWPQCAHAASLRILHLNQGASGGIKSRKPNSMANGRSRRTHR